MVWHQSVQISESSGQATTYEIKGQPFNAVWSGVEWFIGEGEIGRRIEKGETSQSTGGA